MRRHGKVTACCSGLESGYLAILKEYIPSGTIINSQTFLGKKSRKI